MREPKLYYYDSLKNLLQGDLQNAHNLYEKGEKARDLYGLDFSEGASEEFPFIEEVLTTLLSSYDFTRCVRPDGSAYGTRGKCKKGTEGAKGQVQKSPENTGGGGAGRKPPSEPAGGGGGSPISKAEERFVKMDKAVSKALAKTATAFNALSLKMEAASTTEEGSSLLAKRRKVGEMIEKLEERDSKLNSLRSGRNKILKQRAAIKKMRESGANPKEIETAQKSLASAEKAWESKFNKFAGQKTKLTPAANKGDITKDPRLNIPWDVTGAERRRNADPQFARELRAERDRREAALTEAEEKRKKIEKDPTASKRAYQIASKAEERAYFASIAANHAHDAYTGTGGYQNHNS